MSYSYYNNGSRNQDPKKDPMGELFSWILILLCLAIFWPLGLFLLIKKLSEGKPRQENTVQQIPSLSSPVTVNKSGTGTAAKAQAARKSAAAQTQTASRTGEDNFARKVVRTPPMTKKSATLLKIGGALVGVFGLYNIWSMARFLYLPLYRSEIFSLTWYGALLVGGIIMLTKGLSMDRASRRYSRIYAAIGNSESISFSQLSSILGYSEKKLIKDLDRMINRNYFGNGAYLDRGLGYFFMNRAAAVQQAGKAGAATQKTTAPKETEGGYSGVLRAIRRANDRIADPLLSAKIDRLEEVTAKIFRAIEHDPAKGEKVQTFLEYYLPTTQKLLDSYAEFEETGVNGANLQTAKVKIQDTMDNIVHGFENQLDALYASDALDIQSDIDVMNNMMQRDSAMATSDFTVTGSKRGTATARTAEPEGSAAAQTQPKEP